MENVSIEPKEILQDETYKNIIKHIPQEVEINDNEKKEKYILFEENSSICTIKKDNIKIFDIDALNYISSNFSYKIRCLLAIWHSHLGKNQINCYHLNQKSEFITCDEAEGKLGFECSKWNNIKAIRDIQTIRVD